MDQITNRAELYKYASGNKFKGLTTEQIFTHIMENRTWEETESVSGAGSAISQAQQLIKQLPIIFKKYGIRKLLDTPCGDFNWMKETDLSEINYTGGDIVEKLIENNNEKYASDNISFLKMDLLKNIPNDFDMLFCRDCLVHFSFADIFQVLDRVKNSNIKYLMTTTFPGEPENKDIATGGWRPLNFVGPPFNLPDPIFLLNENCTEMGGIFKDKSMGVWEIEMLN